MAWIEVHQSLPPHRKIKRLKRTLKIKTAQAVGHMIMLWLWCVDNAPEGRLTDMDPEDIAEAAEWTGDPQRFLDALIDSGFVDVVGDTPLIIHDWNEYTGQSLNKRNERKEQNKERQQRYRDRKKDADEPLRKANVTRYVTHDEVRDVTVTNASRNAPNLTLPNLTLPNHEEEEDKRNIVSVTRNAVTPSSSTPKSRAADAYMSKINPTPSSSSMHELLAFERELGSDVCLRAIDVALDNNARTWTYVRAILRAKQEQGIKSLEDWDKAEADRLNAKHRNVASKATEEDPDGFRGPSDLGDNEAIFKEMEGWM